MRHKISSTVKKITSYGLIIWFVAVLFFLYEFFLRTLIGGLASQLIPQLHLSSEQFALLETGYAIAYGSMQIPAGVITDKFGLRKVMTLAVVGCAISILLLAGSHQFYQGLVSRVLMGIFSSFSFICLLMVIFAWLPQKFSAIFTGLAQFIGTLGPILAAGPFVLIVMHRHEDWRSSLLYVALFGLVLALITWGLMRERGSLPESIRVNITSPRPVYKRLASVLRDKQIWFIATFTGASYVPITLLGITWGTSFLQAQGFSQVHAADIVSFSWLGYAVVCPCYGFLSDLTYRRRMPLWIAALIGLIATLGICFMHNLSFISYSILFAMVGMAAAGQSVAFVMIADRVEPCSRASALGLNNTMISVFIAIMPFVIGFFIHHQVQGQHIHFSPSDFQIGFLSLPLLYGISFILSFFFLEETHPMRLHP